MRPMRSPRRFCTVMVMLSMVIIACSSAAAQDPGETTINAPEAGFRLTLPDVGWVHSEQRGADGLSAVSIGPEPAGGLIALAIQVSVVADDSAEAVRAHIQELRGAIAAEASITDVEDFELDIDDHRAQGLEVVQAAGGQVFRVYLVFLRARGIQYRIQFHAPRDEFDEQWVFAQKVLKGFALTELDDSAQERRRLRGLAARCGSQIPWAADWDDAARRAREEGRLIVVSVFAQRGFELGNALNEGVFMSPEVIALMNHRFVGWQWSTGMPAPFVDHDVFGLSPSTFGLGLLVCTPDGQVVRQIFLPMAELVADGLRSVLREHPELAPPPTTTSTNRAEQAAFLIDSGQLDAARVVLAEPVEGETGAVAYQRVRLHHVERDGEAALSALRLARRGASSSEGEAAPSEATLLLEEAQIQIGLGRTDAAGDLLGRCLERSPDAAQQAEAGLLQGLLSWAEGDAEEARAQWLAVTREFPEQPAAWVAAAGVVGPALEMDLTPDVSWPSETLGRLAVIPAPAPAPKGSMPVITSSLSDAIVWLLEAQRSDGGWDLPFAERNTHPAPDQITMASQAICTQALARSAREHTGLSSTRAAQCRAAAVGGLRRYLANRELARAYPRPVAFMDYTCWGSAYGLFCLTDVLQAEQGLADALTAGEREAVNAEAAHLIADLVRVQAPNGGWSYYISGVVDGQSSDTAMSFTTATVLNALHAARTQGFEVPAESLERGYACLSSMRGANGIWEYMRQGSGPHAAGDVPPQGAAARGPLCALAMWRGGLLDDEVMKPAFEIYIEHLDGFGAEARKALMHAGMNTQGSHYLLYDYSTAAEALRATDADVLDGDTRQRTRTAILRQLARCRNADGSFVDNPLIGCAPGTGLAIFTLLDLMLDPAAPSLLE